MKIECPKTGQLLHKTDLKRFKVVRVIKEEYEVVAKSKDEAKLKVQDPNRVTVVKETITQI